jgi:hypothetical protein
MKRHWKVLAVSVLAVVLVLAVAGVALAAGARGTGGPNAAGRPGPSAGVDLQTVTTPSASVSLSQAEKDYLALLREEEKMARDVYATLYDTWKLPVFDNIASAETQHMEAIETLLDRYRLSDPAAEDVPGTFVNQTLQNTYDELVRQGAQSLTNALEAGVSIETLDIGDLQGLLAATTHPDITRVAQNLLAASRNHLAAFDRLLAG